MEEQDAGGVGRSTDFSDFTDYFFGEVVMELAMRRVMLFVRDVEGGGVL